MEKYNLCDTTELKPTQIIIDTSVSEFITNNSNWKIAEHYPLFLSRNNEIATKYSLFQNLSNTHHIDLFERSAGTIKSINLANNIRERIAQFLREEAYLDFECHEFIHFLKNKKLKTPLSHYREYTPFVEEKLSVWDIIDMLTNTKSRHMALYLWNWYYLSKAGKIWRLVVMWLEEMKYFFGGEDVFILKEKNLNWCWNF